MTTPTYCPACGEGYDPAIGHDCDLAPWNEGEAAAARPTALAEIIAAAEAVERSGLARVTGWGRLDTGGGASVIRLALADGRTVTLSDADTDTAPEALTTPAPERWTVVLRAPGEGPEGDDMGEALASAEAETTPVDLASVVVDLIRDHTRVMLVHLWVPVPTADPAEAYAAAERWCEAHGVADAVTMIDNAG